MKSPLATVQAAAVRLRGLATDASPVPWTVNEWGNVETCRSEEVAEVWPLNAPAETNAMYIATMHPGTGVALAEWLEHVAAMAERTHSLFADSDSPDEFVSPYALALARQILGES
jgi:hypothetical protein